MLPLARLICIGLVLALLAGCGGPTGITQESQTEHYNVRLTLDGAGFGERTMTIEVSDKAGGARVSADLVVLAPVMRDMGMASPEITAQMQAPGRYEAKGELFNMLGTWELDVRISAGGADETAIFKIDVTEP
jgi:hypothetical protein